METGEKAQALMVATYSQEMDMWKDHLAGMSTVAIAEKYGFSQSGVSRRLRRIKKELISRRRDDAAWMRDKAVATLEKVQSRAWEIIDFGRDGGLPLSSVLKGLPVIDAMKEIRECEVIKAKIYGLLNERNQGPSSDGKLQVNIAVINADGTQYKNMAEAVIVH